MKIAVIGLGRFGESLASELVKRGWRVLGLDTDEVLVNRLSARIPCVVLDATDESALREVNITNFDIVVVSIGSDFESNLLATAALNDLGVRHIICRSTAGNRREILLRLGADRVVDPDSDIGRQLATEVAGPNSPAQLKLGAKHRVASIRVPDRRAGERLAQIGPRPSPEITVMAIQRGSQSLVDPRQDTILIEGDLLIVLGSNAAIKSLADWL